MKIAELNRKYIKETKKREDAPVINLLHSLPKEPLSYLELAAGTGRFPLLLSRDPSLEHIDITCIDISKDLVDALTSSGLNAVQGDVRSLPFDMGSFDVVHASHIIEHFGYPDISDVLDEMFRVLKKGGYLIVRSPLMHPNFFNDLDHIRPYPPKSVLQYYANEQQQKTGKGEIKLISNWNRRQTAHIALPLPGITRVNNLLKKLWIKYGWPRGRANGYVAVFQKQ